MGSMVESSISIVWKGTSSFWTVLAMLLVFEKCEILLTFCLNLDGVLFQPQMQDLGVVLGER